MQLLTGFTLSAIVATTAWRLHALSRSGALAAWVCGGLIFGIGGLPWATLLLAFFISSSALSRLFATRKRTLSEKFSKGSRRDWAQVAANGGLGALLAIIQYLYPGQAWVWVAYAGAMAAVNADTWATEVGVLDPKAPRLITNGKAVERGTSGAVSLYGSLAALAGALLIAVLAALLTGTLPASFSGPLMLMLACALGGLCGSFIDSLLGASVQAIYFCPACQKETERHPRHTCGTTTQLAHGWRWLDNDGVNFAASLAGALIALAIWAVSTVCVCAGTVCVCAG